MVSITSHVDALLGTEESSVTWKLESVIQTLVLMEEHALKGLTAITALVQQGLMARIVNTILMTVRHRDVTMGLVLMVLTRTYAIVVPASLVSHVRQTLMNALLVSTHHSLILSL